MINQKWYQYLTDIHNQETQNKLLHIANKHKKILFELNVLKLKGNNHYRLMQIHYKEQLYYIYMEMDKSIIYELNVSSVFYNDSSFNNIFENPFFFKRKPLGIMFELVLEFKELMTFSQLFLEFDRNGNEEKIYSVGE